jgi:hypothetical protein
MFRRVLVAVSISCAVSSPAFAYQPQDSAAAPVARCEALAAEAAGLRLPRSAAARRKVGGFLAGVAGRALAYAPPVDVGDAPLSRAVGQAVESEAHGRVRNGLDAAAGNAGGAPPSASAERLGEIQRERASLGCDRR